MSLMESLGLDKVEADPNAIPDGKYIGEVVKDEYVYSKAKDSISHVLTYKVTDPDSPHKGAQRQEWFTLGTNPQRDENGNLTGLDITMSEQAKGWYKKRFVDLGVKEDDVPNVKPGDMTGKKVTFGVKRNGDFININFVELREATAQATPEQTGNISGLL